MPRRRGAGSLIDALGKKAYIRNVVLGFYFPLIGAPAIKKQKNVNDNFVPSQSRRKLREGDAYAFEFRRGFDSYRTANSERNHNQRG